METWPLRGADEMRLEAFDHDCLQRIHRHRHAGRVSSVEITPQFQLDDRT